MRRKPLVHHPVESIALVGIAEDGIRVLLGCIDAEMMGLPSHRAEVARLPKQPFVDRYASPLVGGIELPGLAAEVLQMAPDSNTEIGFPPGPSGSTIAGMRLFGEIARNSGLNWSPWPMLTGYTTYGSPHSSSMIEIFQPFGVGQ